MSIAIRNDWVQANHHSELDTKSFQASNKIAQLAMGQAVLNSLNFVVLSLGEWNWQNIHEHGINIVVMVISFYFSDSHFRKLDVWLGEKNHIIYGI